MDEKEEFSSKLHITVADWNSIGQRETAGIMLHFNNASLMRNALRIVQVCYQFNHIPIRGLSTIISK